MIATCGDIALGHSLVGTGASLMAALLPALRQQSGRHSRRSGWHSECDRDWAVVGVV